MSRTKRSASRNLDLPAAFGPASAVSGPSRTSHAAIDRKFSMRTRVRSMAAHRTRRRPHVRHGDPAHDREPTAPAPWRVRCCSRSPHSLIRHRSCTHHPSPAGAPPYGIGPPLAQSMIRLARARHTTEAVSALSAATPPQYWTSFPVGAAACRVGSAWCRTAPGPSPVPLRRFSATSTGTASSPPSRNPLRMLHIVTLTARRSTRRARRSCRSGVITLLGAWVSDGALGRGGAWWRSGFRPWWAGRWRR